MLVKLGEYHPLAACLMYRGCGDSDLVRSTLDEVTRQWREIGQREAAHHD